MKLVLKIQAPVAFFGLTAVGGYPLIGTHNYFHFTFTVFITQRNLLGRKMEVNAARDFSFLPSFLPAWT